MLWLSQGTAPQLPLPAGLHTTLTNWGALLFSLLGVDGGQWADPWLPTPTQCHALSSHKFIQVSLRLASAGPPSSNSQPLSGRALGRVEQPPAFVAAPPGRACFPWPAGQAPPTGLQQAVSMEHVATEEESKREQFQTGGSHEYFCCPGGSRYHSGPQLLQVSPDQLRHWLWPLPSLAVALGCGGCRPSVSCRLASLKWSNGGKVGKAARLQS